MSTVPTVSVLGEISTNVLTEEEKKELSKARKKALVALQDKRKIEEDNTIWHQLLLVFHECGGLEVLSEEDIWENARRVWDELRNHKVGSAYVQAYRFADKVIKAKGDDTFLSVGGNFHTGVTQDFEPTLNGGLAKKDKEHVPIRL